MKHTRVCFARTVEIIQERIEGRPDTRHKNGAVLRTTSRGDDLVAHLLTVAGQQVLQATPTGLDRLVENSGAPGRAVQKWEPERVAARLAAGRAGVQNPADRS